MSNQNASFQIDEKYLPIAEYALKMRLRGDSYILIHNFLEDEIDDESVRGHIISVIDHAERQNKFEVDNPFKDAQFPVFDGIIATLLMLGGVAVFFIFKDGGFVGFLQFVLFGSGLAMLLYQFDIEMTRKENELFFSISMQKFLSIAELRSKFLKKKLVKRNNLFG